MKKIGTLCVILLLIIAGCILPFASIDLVYDKKVNNSYYEGMGYRQSSEKNTGIKLQSCGINEGDNLFIYGSSELSTSSIFSHPNNMFKGKADGFQVNLVGRGHCQSIIHAINFGALGSKLKNQKVVFIISPQWFAKDSLTSDQLLMNFSELQFYMFMSNSSIGDKQKRYVANRIAIALKGNDVFKNAYIYAKLYSNNKWYTNLGLDVLKPYYAIHTKVLSLKDKKDSLKYLQNIDIASKNIKTKEVKIDWDKQLEVAESEAQKNTNNNDFKIDNTYYNTYIKQKLTADKDTYKNDSFLSSPEYDDFKLLLDVCKQNNISPLFVSVPVNGVWYDYCGFSKENRQQYYSKLNNIVSSYNFNELDLSKYEYEPYFLKDIMHLGWKGWVYIDKAIDGYYHSN